MAELRERLHIAVGVILDQATDKVLVARRPGHVHLGGLLEFPGGKLDPGEDVRNALSRELREELNISVTRARQLIQIKYDYPGESVLLDVWLVTDWGGTPKGMEGQEIMWIRKNALAKSEFPDANQQIITAINLPPVYGITPDLADYGDEFYGRLAKILEKGLRLIQFRSKRLDAQSKRRTLRRIYKLCNEFNCRILINGIADADMLDSAHGLHLTSSDLNSLHERPPGENLLVAASCHSSEEIEQACRLGVDFAVLSPVNKTHSHVTSVPIGWSGFSRLVQDCCIPVYALGGMQMADIDRAWSYGGQGVAMVRGLWNL